MIKILCISHSSLNAGAEKAFVEMIKALSFAENDVVCIFPNEGPLIKECLPFMKSYYIIPLPWWFGYNLSFIKKIDLFVKILLSSWNIRRHIHRIKADKVIVNSIAIPSAAIGAKFAGKPVYWFLHELGDDGFSLIFGEKLSKTIIGYLSYKVLCNSQYIRTHYSKFIKNNKLVLAYQSVDIIIKESYRDSSFITFGLVGRISEQKGQKEAILALMKLPEKNIRLILVGSDKNKFADQLKHFVEESGISGKVIFTGEIDEVEKIYAKLDALISCGWKEAFGRTTIEAMKFGLPVIVPDTFGHRELVEDGKTGLYYQLRNAIDLAYKMRLLLNDEYRIRLGENGRQWAENHFSMINFSSTLTKILQTE